jgi:archaemetzincin
MGRVEDLTILPLNDLDSLDLDYAYNLYRSRLGGYLKVRVSDQRLNIEGFPYRLTRFGKQYLADAILEEGLRLKGEGIFILLTSSDIYTAGLNYVFGLAVKGCAVVSKARIDPAFWRGVDEIYAYASKGRLFFEKQYGKVLIHEAGHTLGLPHCSNESCVMLYSNSPLELYRKGEWFCQPCLKKLISALGRRITF